MKILVTVAVGLVLVASARSEDWRTVTVRTQIGTNTMTTLALDDTYNPPRLLDSFYILPTVTNMFTNAVALRLVSDGATNPATLWQMTLTNNVTQTNGAVFVNNFGYVFGSGQGLCWSNSWTQAVWKIVHNWKRE